MRGNGAAGRRMWNEAITCVFTRGCWQGHGGCEGRSRTSIPQVRSAGCCSRLRCYALQEAARGQGELADDLGPSDEAEEVAGEVFSLRGIKVRVATDQRRRGVLERTLPVIVTLDSQNQP